MVATTPTEQTKERAREALLAGVELPGTGASSLTKTARPVLRAVQPSMTVMP
jgi:hypothetical protein